MINEDGNNVGMKAKQLLRIDIFGTLDWGDENVNQKNKKPSARVQKHTGGPNDDIVASQIHPRSDPDLRDFGNAGRWRPQLIVSAILTSFLIKFVVTVLPSVSFLCI